MRSSYEQAFETLTAATFVCEAGSQWKITFHEDSTVEYDCDGEFYSGTWWFEDAYTVNYEFDVGNDETDDETKKKRHRLLYASGRTADENMAVGCGKMTTEEAINKVAKNRKKLRNRW